MLADSSGLRNNLVHIFGRRETADRILTMAYNSLVAGSSLCISHFFAAYSGCFIKKLHYS